MKTIDTTSLKQIFKGEIILPDDAAYEEVRHTPFAEGSPAVVLRAKSADDVAAALKWVAGTGLVLSIRAGGHNGAGFSTNDGGVVLDLSAMKGVETIDTDKHIVRIACGEVWGDIAKTLHKDGLAISSGDTVSVGVGGLTLGGGVGWMLRKYGLAIDSLVAAEVITADGQTLRASATENPDLFWALRGGGGNFGVVTAFEFVAHPIGKVYAGHIVYGLDNLTEVLTGWRDAMRSAPEELTTMVAVLPSFGGMPPSAIIMCCYAGDDKTAADKAVAPLRQLGKVVSDDFKQKEYFEVLEEAHPPKGVEIIVKNGFVKDFSSELIGNIAGMYHGNEGPIFQLRWLGGAMSRIPAEETAFAYRDSEVLIISPIFLQPGASKAERAKALESWRQKIAPFAAGTYINFLSDPAEDVASMYPPTALKRLRLAKKTYDPDNLFSQNYNIKT